MPKDKSLKPYPGFKPPTSSDSPRPQPRVKQEAEANANKAKGSFEIKYGPKTTRTPQPEPKCHGEAANQNCEAGRGTVGNLLGKRPTPRLNLSARAVPRVKPEASSIAHDKKALARSENHGIVSQTRTVTPVTTRRSAGKT